MRSLRSPTDRRISKAVVLPLLADSPGLEKIHRRLVDVAAFHRRHGDHGHLDAGLGFHLGQKVFELLGLVGWDHMGEIIEMPDRTRPRGSRQDKGTDNHQKQG